MKCCSIRDCGREVDAKGYCTAHYNRWRRHGDPLAGRTGRGEAARFLEDVVYYHDADSCLLWPYGTDQNGYPIVGGQKQRKVTRLVCERVHGPPPSNLHQAAHSCGNGHRGCVAKRHLRWATPKENAQDKFLHGTQVIGERFVAAKLTAKQVLEIRDSAKTQRALAAEYGVTASNIANIKRRQSWKWL